jgi:hypothetical protein
VRGRIADCWLENEGSLALGASEREFLVERMEKMRGLWVREEWAFLSARWGLEGVERK